MRRFVPLFAAALFACSIGTAHAGKEKNSARSPALQGYCPVAYVAMGKAVKGNPKISLEYQGHRYRFSSADAKKMFEADPSKYQVGYDGWCATAVSMGKKLKSDPRLFTVHEGVAYLFSNADAKKMFDAHPGEVVSKANEQWATLSQ